MKDNKNHSISRPVNTGKQTFALEKTPGQAQDYMGRYSAGRESRFTGESSISDLNDSARPNIIKYITKVTERAPAG
ncbi:hypothetical protein [Paraburkholderia bannensis]|uniref:hypothetical protein n=1 Tax=Paraburkholderia bannensis TaxID=765414 RepID=UPI002ABE5ACE|nr:hypothetical protein [Paraburkholderia bannensis]